LTKVAGSDLHYFRTVGKAIERRDSRKGSLVVTTNEFEHAVAARTDHKPQKNLSRVLTGCFANLLACGLCEGGL
jgi:hypothetical protein